MLNLHFFGSIFIKKLACLGVFFLSFSSYYFKCSPPFPGYFFFAPPPSEILVCAPSFDNNLIGEIILNVHDLFLQAPVCGIRR